MSMWCCHPQEVAGPYDAVIIAAPLEQSEIEFDGIDIARRPKRTYQETVTTYVTGTLRPGYFGVSTLPTGECFTCSRATCRDMVASPRSW